jgi:hypothetical protein
MAFDLGTLDPGLNELSGNIKVDICISTNVLPDTPPLEAEGNVFGTADCSLPPGSAPSVPHYDDCSLHGGGIGVNGTDYFESTAIYIDNCN